MPRAQLWPCLAPGGSWWLHGKGLDYGCQFCAASRRFGVARPPVVYHSSARNREAFALRYQFGGSRLQSQREGLWSACRRLSLSKQTACILMENRESITANTMRTDDSCMTHWLSNKNDGHLGVASVNQYMSNIALPSVFPRTLRSAQISVVEQAFLLLGFIACTASFALFALIVTAIPTLHTNLDEVAEILWQWFLLIHSAGPPQAMRRAAVSVEKLADIAREELPGTMAAIRLSGMEISDLTLELNDLSQEISHGVRNSARAVQAAEVGIRRIGVVAASQTFAMLQETASVPVQVVRPAVVSAAATTLHAVSQAQKLVVSLASSSYPHISGWLGQRGLTVKPQKPAADVSSSTATLTKLLTGQNLSESCLISGASELSLFDDTEGHEGTVIRVQPRNEN